MSAVRSALLIVVLASVSVPGLAQEFPRAPPKLKEAEAQGLPRVSTAELKQLMPGKVDSKSPLLRRIKTFKADGTVDTNAYWGGDPVSGTWRFDETNNAYCQQFPSAKNVADRRENCFAVFRAPDGTHFFDYDAKTGFFEHTWRRISE